MADIISDIRNKLDSGMIKSEGRGCGQFRVLELTNMSRVHRELRGEDGIQVIREGVDVYVQVWCGGITCVFARLIST